MSMANLTKQTTKYQPKLDNYLTSLQYEGVTLKKNHKPKSIDELKRQYAK
jgi:hypothetical protein